MTYTVSFVLDLPGITLEDEMISKQTGLGFGLALFIYNDQERFI